MTVYRCILPSWASGKTSDKKVVEGQFTQEQIQELNGKFYNIYYLPNYPSIYNPGTSVEGSQIDVFKYVFVDMDLKDNVYKSKDEFIAKLSEFAFTPTKIIDSGNGIHAYWQLSDLGPLDYLKLQRRLIRYFNTDEAVGQIFQLLRVPGTVNTKVEDSFKLAELLYEVDSVYTCEDLDKHLLPLTHADEQYCKQHYEKTYKLVDNSVLDVDDKIPLKFAHLIKSNAEVQGIWSGTLDDRSKGDYRLGHIMMASGFTRDEAISTLVNSSKALARAPIHRISYATNIVDKIWTFEETKSDLMLSSTVKEILDRSGTALKGTRFPCWSYIDATTHGFRLGQVIGLVAGSGVGKTAVALNMFLGFVQNNPDYDHFFIPLEQPANEIADRWKSMCEGNEALYDKVHVISNYDDKGGFRHLSLSEIKDYILSFQLKSGRKVGCIVIDHIGALKKKGQKGENQDLMDICHTMKAFAIETNTLLVMQSQAPREKAGIGDLELNKDAAYGTVFFESYCDYLITIWQPLKRCYAETGCPTVTAFKFCKIRHKQTATDNIQEDVLYRLLYDSNNHKLRELTQDEEKSFDFFNKKSVNKRKTDRKTDVLEYKSMPWTKEVKEAI